MKSIVEGLRIAGFRAVVPREAHSFPEDPAPFTAEEATKLAASTGVRARRVAPPHVCASDLCVAAAEGLLDQLARDPATIDVPIFVSRDPDHAVPATACVMRRRPGLPSGAACFDVNLGCSGFVYALWTAGRLIGGAAALGHAGRALVPCGDTGTRHLLPDGFPVLEP